MMTEWHDSATKLFKENPQLAAYILRDLMEIPLGEGAKPVPLPQVLSDKPPSDLIPDLAFLVGPARKASRCVIVELQTEMTRKKRRQWPRYAAALWLKYECPVDLLVICPDESAAGSCRKMIYTNLAHYACPPKVLFPRDVPAVTTAEEVTAQPGLAVLSVAYHGTDPKVTDAFVAGTAFLGEEGGNNYYDWGYSMSAPVVQQMMEELLNTTYRLPNSPTLRKEHEAGLAEGREEAKAEAVVQAVEQGRKMVLRLLEARDLVPTKKQRETVEACEDPDTLELWADRAVTASSADDIFR